MILLGIVMVLIVLWALAVVASITLGGFVHILLVAAVGLLLLRVLGGNAQPAKAQH